MRVLVIEDEGTLREQLIKRLRTEGYAVDAATDGEEGLYLGDEHPFDLGVVDLGLPRLSGIKVIKELRRRGKRFPILILTARGRWQDKVEGLEAGADDYLVKPFAFKELVARVRALARRRYEKPDPLIRIEDLEACQAGFSRGGGIRGRNRRGPGR